jgi:Leucine-rich repeat (LRR) protein
LKLETLCLLNNKIERIEGLDNLRELKTLILDGNKIEKIEGLDNLVNLKVLSLFNNPLKGLKRIKKSYMGDYIALTVISPYLRNLINLEEFNGKNYPDSDIYPI